LSSAGTVYHVIGLDAVSRLFEYGRFLLSLYVVVENFVFTATITVALTFKASQPY